MKLIIRLVVSGFICALLFDSATRIIRAQTKIKTVTEWQIEPLFKYDALCFLNLLTGDSFYRKFYAKEYSRFEPRLSPQVRKALANLKRKLKDDISKSVSAFLSLHFSVTDAETLFEMSNALGNTDEIKSNLRKTVYYNKDAWKLFESVKKDLKVIFSSALRFIKRPRVAEST